MAGPPPEPAWPLYRYEGDLLNDLIGNIQLAFSSVRGVTSEFDYSRGRTDVVAVQLDGAVLAIEGKLTRWRDALHQAYRNKCFAHRSYVALPPDTASRALRSEQEFRDREVGILIVTPNGVEVALEPVHEDPLEWWLTERAAIAVDGWVAGTGRQDGRLTPARTRRERSAKAGPTSHRSSVPP